MNDWEIPKYLVCINNKKKSKYALVIPVINEGDKIRNQLSKISTSNFGIDIVISDGGSTDNSLHEDFIKKINLRALLIKNDIGKLSSQLRIAYSWCIKEGYEGIITIDGNDKDDIVGIPNIIAKMEEGYDYIQGSRYIKGGVSLNTPLDRALANRLIHAPLLSFSSGYHFTDTTNGFRGYSAKFLTDPRVKPFRSIFQNYELLFYLTKMAGKLGFKVCEVPVSRKYPPKGKTPTKIAGLSGKLGMLKETLQVVLGFGEKN